MATYRIGIGSFSLAENGGVGVGTDATGQGNLKVKGILQSTDLDIPGVSTFTRYGGFSAESGEFSHEKTLTGEYNTSGDIVVGLGNTLTLSGIGSTLTVGTVESVSIGTHFSPPTAGTEDRGEAPVEGTVRYNTDLGTLEFYNGVDWRQFTINGTRGRGVGAGGKTPTVTAEMSYIEISTLGNTQNFGDLTVARFGGGACASATRGIWAGGATPTRKDEIDYITLSSEGNTIDFGNLTVPRVTASSNSGTRGIFWQGGKQASPGASTVIDYVEIATVGNAVDFGDTVSDIDDEAPGVAGSPTRSVAGGGGAPAMRSDIEFVTISSKGNSYSVGDLTQARISLGAVSSTTRIVWGGGRSPGPVSVKTMDYATIASLGSATDFGDLTVARGVSRANASTHIRGVWMGGGYASPSPTNTNVMDYITIATEGNALSFGELSTDGLENSFACSDANGGLGGF